MIKKKKVLKIAAKIFSSIMIGITFIHHPIIWHFRERATRDAYKFLLKKAM